MKRRHETETDALRDSDASQIGSRLGACEVCAAREARYTCPKCEVKTCSLPCVRIHKAELDCNGIRDRTKFIALSKMTKMDFMSDYYFLEECTRYVADRKSDRLKSFTRFNKSLPPHLFRLRNAALERGVVLRFLLNNFSRRKENTTYLDRKQNCIVWHVQWVFVNAGMDGLRCSDKKCAEDKSLKDLLTKYLAPGEDDKVPGRKELEYYQSAGVYGVQVLLKAEGIKRCKNRFYVLDVNKTLRQNLSGKTIVEFPCIYLTYHKDLEGFDVIDSDEDVEAESKRHRESLANHRKQLVEGAPSEETDKTKELEESKRHEERLKKRQELEGQSSNLLFTEDNLWSLFPSSDSENEGKKTEEEEGGSDE